jgi:flavin reductase (DIM6/NTAB) family NADH-FMN oxidoreductase RutF
MMDDPIKEALTMMPYGFYCISSGSGSDSNVMVANWLTQTSFEPRMLALGLQKTSYSHGLISQTKVFAVNIFRSEDAELVKPFTKSRAKNPDKMSQAKLSDGAETGCPILDQAAAYLECRVVEIVDIGGDHDIVVGEVVGAGVRQKGEAADSLKLTDLGWNYAG